MGLLDSIKRRKEEMRRKKDEQEKAAALAAEQSRQANEAKKQRIADCPFMKALMNAIQKESWIICRQGTSDDGTRIVRVTNDCVEFKSDFGHVAYNFVQNGYAPLELTDLMLFAEVITDRIAEFVPGTYSEYYYGYDGDIYASCRKYTLPYPSHKMY